jgi:hypothetical protein
MIEPDERELDPHGADLRVADHWTAQVRLLTQLIAHQPQAPVNYVLRGEEWLICGDAERARADFERARQIAERLEGESAWGYIYQSYVDRADAGLRLCERHSGAEPGAGAETAKTSWASDY